MITANQSRELAVLIRGLTPMQKADFYYFTIVKNEEPYEFLSSLGVQKHQEHDQSSHGNWAGESSPNDYGMSHRPALGEGYGASLDDVTNGIYPDDVYSPRGVQIYGTGYKDLDKKAHAMIMEYRGKPDKTITIYRAVPKNPNASKINVGDWVTPLKEYAVQHGESNLNNDFQILVRDVKAKEIFTSGDSWLEWGYSPESVQKHEQHDQSTHGNWAGKSLETKTGLGKQAKNFQTFEQFSRAVSLEGLRPRAWHITDKENFNPSKDVVPISRTGAPSEKSILFVGDPATWKDYASGRNIAVEYDLTDLKWEKDYAPDKSGNQGFYINANAYAKLKKVGEFSVDEAVSRASEQQNQMPKSKDEALSIWQSIQKHAMHDQSTHGSWAGTNQITSEQKKAVQAYTQKIGDVTQWRSVAQNIRDGKTSDAPPEFVSSVKTLLNAIDEHSVTPTNAGGKVLLRSGVNWKGKLPAVGDVMSNPVASATWRHNVAEKFASSGDGKPVIIKYGSNTKGLDTSKFGASLFGDEGEFIVSGKFEVVNRDKENGFTYVSVRPVGDVSKHQQHDQSTHGNWATDGSYPTEAVVSDFIYDAVYSYTNRGFKYTNTALRNNMPKSKDVEGMDFVIKATPALTEDKTLLRGVTGGVADMLLNSKVGDGYQDKGFMSTTGNVNVAKFFSANQSDDYAIMVLDVPKGTKAFQPKKFFIGIDDGSDLWGALNAEDEYILARGTKFEITGIDKETRTVNVKVRT